MSVEQQHQLPLARKVWRTTPTQLLLLRYANPMTTSTYAFPVRFALPMAGTFASSEQAIAFDTDTGPALTFASADKDTVISETNQFRISGSGFASIQEAEAAAESVRQSLLMYAVRHNVALDLGRDSVTDLMFSDEVKQAVKKATGGSLIADKLGTTVYSSDDKPQFLGINMTGKGVCEPSFLTGSVARTFGKHSFAKPRALLAAELYTVGHLVARIPARFLLLVSSLEALLEVGPRPQETIDHVQSLIKQTEQSNLPQDEKASLINGLNSLRKESISTAGRRLAAEVGAGQTYGELSASDFFKKIYQLRSQLVHEGQFDAKVIHGLIEELDRLVREAIEMHILKDD